MSFVFKSPNTKYWLAGFRDSTGKRRNRSTKILATEKNKRQAERIAEAYEDAGNRKRTSQQVRRTITDLHRELTGEDLPLTTISAHIKQWLESKKPSVSKNTTLLYDGVTKKFIAHLGIKAEEELANLTRGDVEGFRDSLAKKLTPETVNHNLKVLRMLFRDARDRALIVDDPSEFVKSVKAEKALNRRPFSLDEIRLILTHCDTEWRSMVLFGLYTGQRLGDISKLKWESVDLKKEAYFLRIGKTGKRLSVPLHRELVEHLKSLPAAIDASLPIHPNAAAILQQYKRVAPLSNAFAKIMAMAGLREKRSHKAFANGRDGKRNLHELSFHSLRRTATTLLHENGVSQSVAMALIGHDSEDIHAIYVNVGEKALREASAKLPSLSS